MKINRAYKFRLYPNQAQQEMLIKTIGSCRFLWNKMLDERIQVFQKLKNDRDQLYSYKYMTEKQYKMKFHFLKEVDSKALQSSTRNLFIAFKNFFNGFKQKRKIGFPNFKSRKGKECYTTYNCRNNIKINFQNKMIKLPKIKTWIKFRDDRIFSESIKHITVSKTKSRKYYISILIEKEINSEPKQHVQKSKVVAFDMSLSNFLISTKYRMMSPRFYRKEEKKLKQLHRKVSTKKKGSSNRNKAKLQLARKYEKIYNRKLDWTHKISTDLANKYDVIIVEDLNIKGMQQFNSGISKSVTLDFSWNQFISILQYKMDERGKYLVLVDRWFPSSKLCSNCGWKNNDLKLSNRKWECLECGVIHDRDFNASKNLFKYGLNHIKKQNVKFITTVGTTGSHAWGDDVRLSTRKHLSMNQESTANR